MEFKKALENLQSAKKKKIDAEKHFLIKKSQLAKAREETPQLHDILTDKMAELHADEGSEEAVNDARTKYEQACDRLDDLKTEVAAAEKSIPILNQKLAKVKQQFNQPAYKHYKEQAKPLIDEYLEALNNFERIEKKMQKLRDEIDSHGLSSGNFLPTGIKALKLNHLKFDYSFEKIKKELNDLQQ